MPPLDLRFLLDYDIVAAFYCRPPGADWAPSILVMLSVYFKWSRVRFVSVFCLVSVSLRMILFLRSFWGWFLRIVSHFIVAWRSLFRPSSFFHFRRWNFLFFFIFLKLLLLFIFFLILLILILNIVLIFLFLIWRWSQLLLVQFNDCLSIFIIFCSFCAWLRKNFFFKFFCCFFCFFISFQLSNFILIYWILLFSSSLFCWLERLFI